MDKRENSIIGLGFEKDGKAQLMIVVSEDLTSTYQAGTMIRSAAKHIQGGGGGQAFYATAGGKNPAGIEAALEHIRSEVAK
jgi:alanyl-tRNA synthetase